METKEKLSAQEVMDFVTSHYEGLKPIPQPKTDLIMRIMKRVNVTEQTVRNWVKGDNLPQEERTLEILLEEVEKQKKELKL